jgi:hypothetical protein
MDTSSQSGASPPCELWVNTRAQSFASVVGIFLCGVLLMFLVLPLLDPDDLTGGRLVSGLFLGVVVMGAGWCLQSGRLFRDRAQVFPDAIICEHHGRMAFADIVAVTEAETLNLELRDGRALQLRTRERRAEQDYNYGVFRQHFASAYATWIQQVRVSQRGNSAHGP